MLKQLALLLPLLFLADVSRAATPPAPEFEMKCGLLVYYPSAEYVKTNVVFSAHQGTIQYSGEFDVGSHQAKIDQTWEFAGYGNYGFGTAIMNTKVRTDVAPGQPVAAQIHFTHGVKPDVFEVGTGPAVYVDEGVNSWASIPGVLYAQRYIFENCEITRVGSQ